MSQLAQLNRITVLKDLGFSLEQIGAIVTTGLGAEELRSMLLLRRSDVERNLAAESQRLRQIEIRILQIETEGQLSSDDVVVRPEPARRLLSLRRTLASFAEAGAAIAAVREHARALLPKRHDCQFVVVAHSAQFDAGLLDLELGFALDSVDIDSLPPASPLTLSELPAVPRMATCVREGPPDMAHLATARIGTFLEQAGDRLDGPGREVFLTLPPPTRMHEAVIEMQFPVCRREGDAQAGHTGARDDVTPS
jgi:effector-binding domain-containing protein